MSLIPTSCCGIQTEWFGGLFKHCEPPECCGCGCCGCCPALRPRYKRLVDNIFPAEPEDGLVKNNMEKLTYYSLSSPEKLDRIGEYLAQRMARDLGRHRFGYVVIAMEAMNQLLLACPSQSLNLFVESFLKVIQQLLESQNPDMQILATHSFIKFANIEEDTPSYHRRYDFFVSKFSSLCHHNSNDVQVRKMLRLAGLNGLKGVIQKTVSDDLQVDIWDETHMEKIVPSLLYNMQDQEIIRQDAADLSNSSTPFEVAEECLRELMGKATFGNIRSVIKPVLKHFDNHYLWSNNTAEDFAAHTFKIIMCSIQTQHSYAVIQILMSHLDEKSNRSKVTSPSGVPTTKVRSGIVTVLSNIIAIAAAESIGPSVLEVINSLLNHLRNSINNLHGSAENMEVEEEFQENVINALGEFANNLPDFQKIEIMMFIISKVPPSSAHSKTDICIQEILLKSLLKVSSKYRTVNMSQAFPKSFLSPLLALSVAADPNVRLAVQHIFHQLLDRHNNLPKLMQPLSMSSHPPFTLEKAYRQDVMFMKKHGSDLLCHVYENVQYENNTIANYNAIYTTLALLCLEMGSEETLVELLRLLFAMQDLTLRDSMTMVQKAAIHSLLAGFLHLTAHLTAIPALGSHVEQIIKAREEKAPWMLPEYTEQAAKVDPMEKVEINEHLLFSKVALAESLRSTGHDTSRLMAPFIAGTMADATMARSISDLKSIDMDVESAGSSPCVPRKHPEEGIDFQSFRKILTEPLTEEQELREDRRVQIIERFKRAPFLDLVARSESKSNELRNRLNDIFSKLPSMSKDLNGPQPGLAPQMNGNCMQCRNPFSGMCEIAVNSNAPPLYAIQFPDLYVY